MNLVALLFTLVVGLFFLIGMFIPHFFKDKEKLILFTTSFTFVLLLYLFVFDLLPEILEILNPKEDTRYLIVILLFSLLGFLLLKILDFFVPEHKHEHHEKKDNVKEHQNHFYHIGFITAVSLIIHNLLEGISIYITSLSSLKAGILMALSVGCHNLPLGIEIFISMSQKKEKKHHQILIYTLLILSSFIGAFTLFLLNKELNFYMEGILLSITLGMIFYISICELLPEVFKNRNHKEIKIGLVLGLVLAIVLILL